MEKPKKERKFLKAIGKIAKTLGEELVLGIGRKYIGKVVDKVKIGKRERLSLLFLLSLSLSFASIDSIPYPITGNKQRLGFNTTGNGLVWRGLVSDTVTKPTSYADKNVKAYLVLDSVTGSIYVWKQGAWASLVGGGSFTQPVDSLFFDTSVPTNNVDTAKMRWDSELGTVVLGLYDKVPNELGFKNFWLVKNQTGSTITKNSLVYASGTVGASGRISVSKFIANGTIDAKYLLGITAHDLSDGEDGYVISYGKIRQVNTDTFAAGTILYPSPTVAGVWTDVEPIAPNIDMPIGFCINSSSNNGTIAIRVASGYKLNELHDVAISSPVSNASLYYSGGLWRDTTQALLVSDTAAMLLPYLRKSDTSLLNLTNRFNAKLNISDTAAMLLNYKNSLNAKLNISDTASMLSNYALKSYADTSGRFYARQDFENVSSSTLTWTQSDTLVIGGVTVIQVYRNGQILLPSQYTIPTKTTIIIGSTAYKAGENYTVIFPRGGGASGGGGSGSLTSISAGTGITVSPNPITTTGTVSADLSVLMELTDTTLLNLANRFNTKLNINDTTNMLLPYLRKADTTSMLLPYFRDADTTSLNLTSRFAAKQNTLTLTTTGTSGAATLTGATLNIPQYSGGGGTVTSIATGYGLSGGTITTTGTIILDSATVFTRIRDSIVDVAIGNDTIKILKQEYPSQSSAILNWTVTSKFPIQLKAYILVFRNGQLLNNNQYNITDTAQITLVSTSFKSGANYTVATVSGIGSVGSAQGNPVYPEAGIALSTGTTWTTSITNNSSNWNTAYSDRLKWDGGSTGLIAATGRTSLGGTTIGQSMFTLTNPSAITFPRFNADNSVSALSGANFRSAIGAGTVTSVTAAGTSGNPISITDISSTPVIDILSATSARNGYLTSTDWTIFNNKQNAIGYTPANSSTTISTTAPLSGGGDLSSNKTLSIAQASTNTNGYLTSTDWTTFNNKQTQLNGTGFVKASGTSISYDNSSYLTTSSAASTYLPLTGGTITGDLSVNGTSTLKFTNIYGKNTYTPFNAGIGEQSISNVGSYLRGGTVMIFPDSNLVGSSANFFLANSNVVGVEYSAFGSGLRNYSKQGGDNRRNSFALYTSDIGQQNTNRLYINYNGDIGINDDTPSYKLDVNGTLNATGAATLSSTLAVTGNITEGGNNVLNNLDTVSLSNRIDGKVGLTGNETIAGEKSFSGMMTLNGGLKGKIKKESGTSGFFNPIPSDVVTYIFEYTGSVTGGGTTDFLGSPSSHTNRIINIINVSDVDYFLGFMTNKPYIKTSTQLNQVDYGQSITVQSDGSKWWVISRNF